MITMPMTGYTVYVINPEDSDDCIVSWVLSEEEE